ncbi:MAG: helix-turn-helix transcriptional regulator [Alphaproteobacteria bacterium]|nr:helix-turn-helix transcriptional regulator [Alphaproteobacteria bacterium]
MNIKLNQMRERAVDAEEMLKALANRHRLMILCQLIVEERSVRDLANFLNLRDSTVSQHLALLRKDGFVSTRREGQTIWYALASEPARRLIETLYDIYCGPQSVHAQKSASRRGRRSV